MMKTCKLAFMIVGTMLVSPMFQSCLDDDKDSVSVLYPNALVTVKNADDNSVFLQFDSKTTLFPSNMKQSPFGKKEVRALVNFTVLEKNESKYDRAVHVNWIDSILTKNTVPSQGEENAAKYGSDPVEVVKDWVTIAEDGYLTLRFNTLWGNRNVTHFVNLVAGVNPDNPYELEFRHNANGDTAGKRGDALVAFSLKDLPDTKGQTVKLKLVWESFSGKKSAEFDFCSREDTEKANLLHGDTRSFYTSIQ